MTLLCNVPILGKRVHHRPAKLGYRRRRRLVNFGDAQADSISNASRCDLLGDYRDIDSLRAVSWTNGLVVLSCPSARLGIGWDSFLLSTNVLGAREVSPLEMVFVVYISFWVDIGSQQATPNVPMPDAPPHFVEVSGALIGAWLIWNFVRWVNQRKSSLAPAPQEAP